MMNELYTDLYERYPPKYQLGDFVITLAETSLRPMYICGIQPILTNAPSRGGSFQYWVYYCVSLGEGVREWYGEKNLKTLSDLREDIHGQKEDVLVMEETLDRIENRILKFLRTC